LSDQPFSVAELRTWLQEHVHEITAFMDYQPTTLSSDRDFAHTLREHWFQTRRWNRPRYRFVHLGHDGLGGEVAAWVRPGSKEPPPIVFFGSEWGHGVLALTPKAWAQALAYAPSIVECGAPSRLDAEGNWYFDDDVPDFAAKATTAVETYREAVISHFGELPSLEALADGLEPLNEEFLAWIASVERP
jgi:hypothetical protein